MFCDYDNIFFEADDVDECAMRLKNIFSSGVKEVFETWIYDLGEGIKQIFKSGGPLFLFAKNRIIDLLAYL